MLARAPVVPSEDTPVEVEDVSSLVGGAYDETGIKGWRAAGRVGSGPLLTAVDGGRADAGVVLDGLTSVEMGGDGGREDLEVTSEDIDIGDSFREIVICCCCLYC